MGKEFEIRKEVELPAEPDLVWDAIATGPGIESWMMGPYRVEPHEGGRVVLELEGMTEESTVTEWDPPHRFAVRSQPGPDGSFHAFEYMVVDAGGGASVLRFVHSGETGDDWGDEFVAMTAFGWDSYFFTLAQYLRRFPGRFAVYVTANAPQHANDADSWQRLLRALGLSESSAAGDPVQLDLAGLPPIEGEVDIVDVDFVGIATDDALYRFHGLAKLGMPPAVGHHLFDAKDREAAAAAWQQWLEGLYGAKEATASLGTPTSARSRR